MELDNCLDLCVYPTFQRVCAGCEGLGGLLVQVGIEEREQGSFSELPGQEVVGLAGVLVGVPPLLVWFDPGRFTNPPTNRKENNNEPASPRRISPRSLSRFTLD